MRRAFHAISPQAVTWWIIAATTVLSAAVAGRVGLGTDGAHYALYGWFPDWSYFDHPPMVGWLQWLALRLSDHEFALRLIPMALLAASSMVLFRLARTLYPNESPWLGTIAVALVHAGLMFSVMGVTMIPEDPLLLFGLLAAGLLYRAVDDGGLRYWLGLGVVLGLAGLSKYTAITLAVSALVFVLWEQRLRLLRTLGPWLSAAIALILIAPVLYWNMQHEWMSLGYQWRHGTAAPNWEVGRFLLSQAAQLLVYTPLLFIGGYIALIRTVRAPRDRATRLLLAMTLPVFLLFGINSGKVPSLPHWTALAWAFASLLAARWLLANWSKRMVRVLAWCSAVYGVVLILLVHSLLFTPWIRFPDYRDPTHDLHGWREAAEQAERLRRELAQTPGPEPVLFTGYWTEASRLAWYARPTPLIVADERRDQFDLWYGAPVPGSRGVFIVSHNSRYPPRTGGNNSFQSCVEYKPLDIVRNDHRLNTFYFYRCENYRP
jgi:hypothetical protein